MEVTVHGFKELRNSLNNTPEIFNTVMKGALTQSAKRIQKRAIINAPEATGNLKGNISIVNKKYSAEIIAKPKYAIFVEKGTKPHWPPIDVMEKYGLLRFGKAGLGFVIARKISRVGTKANPFMRKSFDSSLNEIENIFNQAGNTLIKLLGK